MKKDELIERLEHNIKAINKQVAMMELREWQHLEALKEHNRLLSKAIEKCSKL